MESAELEGLEAFVAVVETGAFAAAARRLGLTTSAVSKKVNKLEGRLRARLLLRSTRKLAMTEAGEAFFAHARRALAEAEAGREAVAGLGAAPRGLLRLAVPMTFGALHVAPAIVPFMRACPEVRVDLVLDDRLQDLVAEGLDMALRIGPLGRAGSVVAQRIAASSTVLCASPDYVARRGEPRNPADLAAHETLHYAYHSGGTEWTLLGAEGRVSIALEPHHRCNNGLALREVALAGGGILRVPVFTVGADLADGRLVRVLPAWRLDPVDIHVVYPDRAFVPRKARAFADFLRARFGDPPYWEPAAS